MPTEAIIHDKPLVEVDQTQVEVSPNAETDKFIAEKREKQRKSRGGIQHRIEELTKQTKQALELAEQAAKAAKPPEPAPQAAAVAATEAPADDPRPARDKFTNDADYSLAIAQWVVRQQEKIKPKTPTTTPTTTPAATDEAATQLRKAEFDTFLAKGKDFIKANPDFNDTLAKAGERGLTMHTAASVAIIRLNVPEVAYWLAKPENDATARKLSAMDPMSQVAEIGRLAERLAIKPEDYISQAGKTGIRLTSGNSRATIQLSDMDTDDYLAQRRLDIKAGIRRR